MDHNVIAASNHFDDHEAYSEAACYRAAEKHGVLLIADDCDDGEHSCPECPWKNTSSKWQGVKFLGAKK